MSRFNDLNNRTVIWAKNKEILLKATPLAQINKTQEELDETKEAIFAQQNRLKTYVNSKGVLKITKDEVIDGIGDMLVTILIQCEMQQINPLDCLEFALQVIEKRTGKMINGQFVKDIPVTLLEEKKRIKEITDNLTW